MAAVSVIIPVYNTEKYLKKCLNSILNQTFKDIEIITINDGSTDNSLKILNSYVAKYPDKFKLIDSIKNQGAGMARNLGINAATGDYIWFVDSDDWLCEDAVEKMYNAAIKYNVSMVTCELQRRLGMIRKLKNSNMQSNLINLDEHPEKLTIARPCIGNKLIKKSLLGDIRMPALKWEDSSFVYALTAKSRCIYHVAEKIYNYRVSLCSASIKDQITPSPRFIEIFEVISILEQHFKDFGLYEKYFEQIQKIYFTHVLKRAVDVSTWINFPRERKELLIGLFLSAIELKCKSINLSKKMNEKLPYHFYNNYFFKKYARSFLNKNQQLALNEEQIREDIVKLLK